VQTESVAPPIAATEPEGEVEPDRSAGPQPLPTAVDTHCHLFLMEQESDHVVADAWAAGVGRLVCVGIDPASSIRSVELAESFRGLFASAGMHPHMASGFDRRAGSDVEELLGNPMVVAVGETGLDYYRRLSPIEDQQRAFRTHIALSRETGKPVIVHVRESWDDALRILHEERAERVVLHCFSGDQEAVEEAAARGYFVSFAGNLTYPTADYLREAALGVPESHLVAETDSPYLPPQAVRGEPNRPANVLAVIGALAEVRGVKLDHMVASTTRAALEAFPLLR
jgi:TatD DNase family protein